MSATAVQFLQRWVVTTLAVLVAVNVVKGLGYDNAAALLVASLLLGFLNAFVRPLLLVLSLPLLLYTLGLFMLVINALLLWMVGSLVKGFHVAHPQHQRDERSSDEPAERLEEIETEKRQAVEHEACDGERRQEHDQVDDLPRHGVEALHHREHWCDQQVSY